MEQPLGLAVGNILEVREAIDALHGRGPQDFQVLTEAVAIEMLLLGDSALRKMQKESGKEAALAAAGSRVKRAIESGAAFTKFVEFVVAQGGEEESVVEPERLASAPVVFEEREGVVGALDARAVGMAVVGLGGGRQRKGEPIDHRVGVVAAAKIGEQVGGGELLLSVHAADVESAKVAAAQLRKAYEIVDEVDGAAEGEHDASGPPVVLERITS